MINWTSAEFHYHEKDEAWPALVIVGALIIGAIALWQRNLLFAIFIGIAAVLMLVWGRRRPLRRAFALDKKGLHIDDRIYPFHDFSSFALYEDALLMHPKSRVRPYFSIIIPHDKGDEIREYLLVFLPEVEYTESFVEIISHWLRF